MVSKVLDYAIQKARRRRLLTTLGRISKESPIAHSLIATELASLQSASNQENSKSIKTGDTGGDPRQGQAKKRECPRYAICINCRQEFDSSTNSGESCHYHDGELSRRRLREGSADQAGAGFLGDEDEERNELDGADFQYSCCRKKLGTSGCKTGPHRETKAEQSQPEIKKKMRLESILC